MRRMFGMRNSWVNVFNRFQYLKARPFCNNHKKQPSNKSSSSSNSNGKMGDMRDLDVYRDLDKLDFVKAAKILFNTPPKKKKFGIDFHLVQLFFACMPSLAVYLVAQYSRYEMRKMEAELELKKKREEEERALEEKENASEEKEETRSDPELVKVKERLEALEETVKEIVVEKKTRNVIQHQEQDPKSTELDSGKEQASGKVTSTDKKGEQNGILQRQEGSSESQSRGQNGDLHRGKSHQDGKS